MLTTFDISMMLNTHFNVARKENCDVKHPISTRKGGETLLVTSNIHFDVARRGIPPWPKKVRISLFQRYHVPLVLPTGRILTMRSHPFSHIRRDDEGLASPHHVGDIASTVTFKMSMPARFQQFFTITNIPPWYHPLNV